MKLSLAITLYGFEAVHSALNNMIAYNQEEPLCHTVIEKLDSNLNRSYHQTLEWYVSILPAYC